MRLSINKLAFLLRKNLGLSLLLSLLPLMFIPYLSNPYEFPKFAALMVIVPIFSSASLIIMLKKPDILRQPADTLTILVITFITVLFIADIFGLDPTTSFLGSIYRHQGLLLYTILTLLFFLVSAIAQKQTLQTFLIMSAFLVSLIALIQAIAVYIFHDLSVPLFQGRIVGTMGNPNFLGGYLATLLPFLWVTKGRKVSGRLRILLALLALSVIILTQSRSAIFASIFVISAILLRIMVNWKYIRIGSAFFSIFFLVVVLAQLWQISSYDREKTTLSLDTQAHYCLYLLPEGVKTFSFFLFERFPSLLPRASFCEGRVAIWTVGIEAIAQRPLLGFGQENFELVFPANRGIKVDNAHNIFLEIAISSGLIGLSLFVAIVAIAFRKASFPIRLSILAFLIVASFNPLSISQLALFWTLLGMSNTNSCTNHVQ